MFLLKEVVYRKDNITVVENNVLIQSENSDRSMTMEKKIKEILKNLTIESDSKNDFNKLKQKFTLFRSTGKRTLNLQNLYDALSTIQSISTDAETSFFISVNFCTKIRSRLVDKSINELLFLKCFYLNHNK